MTVRGSRFEVDHAEGAEIEAVVSAQGNRQVEAQPHIASHQGIGQGPRIAQRVAHDIGLVFKDCRGAQTGLAVDLLQVKAVAGFESDAIGVD